MRRTYQRVKGVFKRNRYYDESSPDVDPDSYDEQDENGNQIGDDAQNVRNDNPSQQSILRRPGSGRTPLNPNPPSTSFNLPNSELRSTNNVIQSDVSRNNNVDTNINPPVNTNTVPISNLPASTDVPTQDPSPQLVVTPTPIPQPILNDYPREINPNQTSPPSINSISQPSLRGSLASTRNRKRRPIAISPNSILVGFPSTQNLQPQTPSPWRSRLPFPRQQARSSFPTRPFPSPPQDTMSHIELDYPIENVFIDGNIPSSVAIKINEAIEYDRFGNTYYTHHYAYEPKTQHIAIGNNQQIERRLIGNPRHTGMRFIREIHNEKFYPQLQNPNNIQPIITVIPQINYPTEYLLNSFPVPINHFIAFASPNDPMQHY